MVLPRTVVDPLPGGDPWIRDLHGLTVVANELSGAEELGAVGSEVIALWLESVLDDVLGIETRFRRVLAGFVHGQLHRYLANRVVVPVDHRAVGHLVLLAVLRGRVLEPRFVEHVGLVVQLGGVDGEGNPELLSAAGLVKVEDALVVPAQVDVFLLDVRIEIQPLALERVGPADPQGADEIGRIAGSQLGRELGTSAAIGGVIVDELDVRLGRVEVLDHLLEHLVGARVVAATQTAEPLQGYRGTGEDRRGHRGLRGLRRRRYLG